MIDKVIILQNCIICNGNELIHLAEKINEIIEYVNENEEKHDK